MRERRREGGREGGREHSSREGEREGGERGRRAEREEREKDGAGRRKGKRRNRSAINLQTVHPSSNDFMTNVLSLTIRHVLTWHDHSLMVRSRHSATTMVSLPNTCITTLTGASSTSPPPLRVKEGREGGREEGERKQEVTSDLRKESSVVLVSSPGHV